MKGMAMKTYVMCVILTFVMSLSAAAKLPQKINILLVDIGTIDTVAKTEKFLAATDKAMIEAPPTPSATVNVIDPELQKQAVRINWLTGMAEYYKAKSEVEEENARRRKVLEGLRNGIVGNSNNRMIVLAKDYLASGLEEYSDFIAVVDRSDASLQEVEKAIANKSSEEVAPATLFLSVTMGDLQCVKKNLQVGDAKVRKVSYSRKATAKVSDFNNVRVFSCDVTAKADQRKSDAVDTSGDNDVIVEQLIEDAMRQIAKKVGEKFVKTYSISVSIPKAAKEEIEADAIEFEMDGEPVSAGEPFKALSIEHTITAKLDDAKFAVSPESVRVGANKTKAVFRIKTK